MFITPSNQVPYYQYPVSPSYPSNQSLQQAQQAKKVIENYSYMLTDQIGKGFSSKVYKGKNDQTNEQVAIKVIDRTQLKSSLHHQLLKSEIEVLSTLDSPFIMKLYKVYQTSNNTYLITEYCENGDLANKLQKQGKLTEQFIQELMRGIVQGYSQLATKRIVHRDLKPANILLNKQNVPKIADFGFATIPTIQVANVNVGSPLYMSPQALKQSKYSDKSDIWALGVSVYEMLTGQVPWQARSEKELANKISSVQVKIPMFLSKECQDFLRRCLIIDENQRMSVEQMVKHPWCQQKMKLQHTPGNHLIKDYTSPLCENNKVVPQNFEQKNVEYMGKENIIERESNNSQVYIKKSVQYLERQDKSLERQKRSVSKYQEGKRDSIKYVNTERNEEKDKEKEENRKKNDYVVLSQINYCRYLNRIFQLLENGNLVRSPNLKEKVQFFVIKNMMIKIRKLKEMCFKPAMNPLNLIQFQEYMQCSSFNKLVQVINQYDQKYDNVFQELWQSLQVNASQLQEDKKFDAIFDQNFTEFESFYIILQSILKQAIKELQQQLDITLNIKDPEELLQINQENNVILLDYLVTFYQLTALILDQFNEYNQFAQQSKIEQIAEGKPVKLTFGHYLEIKNKINQLEI